MLIQSEEDLRFNLGWVPVDYPSKLGPDQAEQNAENLNDPEANKSAVHQLEHNNPLASSTPESFRIPSAPPPPSFSLQLSPTTQNESITSKDSIGASHQISTQGSNNFNPQVEPKGSTKSEKKQPRPPNAWILYRSDKIVEMKSLHHGLAQSLLSKEIAERWHNESQGVKDVYARKADIFKADHALKYPDYKYSPKRKKPIENKKGDQNKTVKQGSPNTKPKKKRSSTSGGQEPTDKITKRPSTPNSPGNFTLGNASPESVQQVISPEKLEADLYSSYPILSHLVAAQQLRSESAFASDFTTDHHLSQAFSEQTVRDLWRPQELESQQYQLFASNDVPIAQPPTQSQWMDFSQLDPQLHFDTRLSSTSGRSLAQWMDETEQGSMPTTSTLLREDGHSTITPSFPLFRISF